MIPFTIKYYIRSLSRRKLFSFINITGLAFGIAFMLLIGQFIYHEFNYNRYLKNVDNIYRIVDADAKEYSVDYRMKEQVLENVSGIKNACLLYHFDGEIESNNRLFSMKNALMVDSNFFGVFNVSFLAGSSNNALSSMDNVVLTESTAKRIFGNLEAVGKTVRINHQSEMLITGVVRDLPRNISFDAELFVSYVNSPNQKLSWRLSSWGNNYKFLFSAFVELEKNADIIAVEKHISSLNNINSFIYPKNVILTSLSLNYFNTDYNEADLSHGNGGLVKLLSIIVIIVLLLVIINFVNLTTASYRYRLTEFGIKKCLGADRKSLIKQLIAESLYTAIISSLVGIILAEFFLPYFNQYTNKTMSLQIFTDSRLFLFFSAFILLLSLIMGILPSLILSKISPLQLFKFNPSLKGNGKIYRNILTMFQFSIAIILLAGLIIISRQIDFVKHKNIGFNTGQLLYIKVHHTLRDRVHLLTDKLHQYHGIKSLTQTFSIPGEILSSVGGYATISIDSTSLKTFGLKIIKGRAPQASEVNKAVLINESSLDLLKDKNWENQKINGCNIVGIVSDFNYASLHNKIGPVLLWYCNFMQPSAISIRISGSVGDAVNFLNKTLKEIYPDYPIEINFYDEQFAAMYKKEENLAALVGIFSILAIIISCMGIFGLSVFQAEQRIKEIGIRKVLGASVSEIIVLLTKSFSKWVILANIIAIPLAYYLMNKWLQDFAYRIELSWWIFILAGLIALMIALITVSYHAVKAAVANPIESLRYE